MAEAIYKRISDLDSASQPLGGTELAEISQGGVSKKVTLTNIFGSGWWAALRAAFSAFVAPEATHAVDSDTVGGETKAQLHDATKLTGAVPLASIPVELTGINAATATLAATATNALACSGNAQNVLSHGKLVGTQTVGTMFPLFSSVIPNTGDRIIASGMVGSDQICAIERYSATEIDILYSRSAGTIGAIILSSLVPSYSFPITIIW